MGCNLGSTRLSAVALRLRSSLDVWPLALSAASPRASRTRQMGELQSRGLKITFREAVHHRRGESAEDRKRRGQVLAVASGDLKCLCGAVDKSSVFIPTFSSA